MIGGLLFAVFALLAAVFGGMILTRASSAVHEIEGLLCFIIAALLFVAAILCSLESVLASIRKLLREARTDAEQRTKAVADVTTERWETLCTSLDRLERATDKSRPPSNVGEDWEPPAAAQTPSLKARCGHCGKTVKANRDWAGRSGKCPGCGSSIRFPAELAAPEL